ncbi:MAG: hypothetical protein RSC66_04615 [Comamonas sp.]
MGSQAMAGASSGSVASEVAKPRLLVIGVDPGKQTGVARYFDGKLLALETVAPWGMRDLLEASLLTAERVDVVFEDSRLQSKLFSGQKATGEAKRLKIARDVGGIDAWCLLLEHECERLGLRCLGVSPKDKGAKVAASAFDHITGWPGRTNEHERDAAMVARPFRKGFH